MSADAQNDPSDLAAFARSAKSAMAKQLRELARESPGADVYEPKTLWDHKEKSKRTKGVRVSGAASGGRQEVRLDLWCRAAGIPMAFVRAASVTPDWNELPGDAGDAGGGGGGGYQRGPVTLVADEAKNTATLIYSEEQEKPFSASSFRMYLGALFDELAKLAASIGTAAAETPAETPSPQPIPQEEAPEEGASDEPPAAEPVDDVDDVDDDDDDAPAAEILEFVDVDDFDEAEVVTEAQPVPEAEAATGAQPDTESDTEANTEADTETDAEPPESPPPPKPAPPPEPAPPVGGASGTETAIKPAPAAGETHAEPTPRVYANAADLMAALESGALKMYETSARTEIEGHEVEVAVIGSGRRKQITVTVEGAEGLDAGTVASCRIRLGDRTYSAKCADGDRLVVGKKSPAPVPPPPAIREALDYAANFLRELAPKEPVAPPEPPPADVPAPETPASEASLPSPPPEEEPSPAEAPTDSGIEVEEVSLDDLLGTSEDETPAPAEAESTESLPEPPPEPPPEEQKSVDDAQSAGPAVEPGGAEAKAEPAPSPAPSTEPSAPPAGARTSANETEVFKLQAQLHEMQMKLAEKDGASVPPDVASPAEPDVEPDVEPQVPEEVPETPFGDFQPRRWIGRDVLGVLYEGENTETKEAAAIKVIDLEHSRNAKFAKDFVREGWTASKLEHPGLNRILTVGRTKQHVYFYASEFVDARSARAVVRSGEGFSVAEAKRVVRAIAEALAYVHTNKLFHGDVRPSYVLLTADGGVKLAEMAIPKNALACVDRLLQARSWGLADALRDERGEARKEMDAVVRERRLVCFYLAPELADSHFRADGRADIYGLGATWYYMLTGKPPFAGVPTMKLLMGEAGKAPPPDALKSDIPQEVSAVIQKMMDPLPTNRYQSMDEVVAAIDRL